MSDMLWALSYLVVAAVCLIWTAIEIKGGRHGN